MKKYLATLCFIALMGLSSSAFAVQMTWNLLTNYHDVNGSITFDDAPIAGLTDGMVDYNDTHIYGATVHLQSTYFNFNYTQANVYFQPLTNTYDNKHIDVAITPAGFTFYFWPQSDQGSPALGVSEYYLYDGNYNTIGRWAFADAGGVNQGTNLNPVPEPSTMILLGTGLVGLVAYMRANTLIEGS